MATQKLNMLVVGMAGVDMKSNPLYLSPSQLHSATNIQFDEGVIKTRQGFRYHDLGVDGKYQGGIDYTPSRGLSHKPFANPTASIVMVVGSSMSFSLSNGNEFLPAEEIQSNLDTFCDTYLYQAENYLILQSPSADTMWWEGFGAAHSSLGLDAPAELVQDLVVEIKENQKTLVLDHDGCCFHKMEYCTLSDVPSEDYLHHSHDSFETSKHRQFLVNSVNLGVYAHGRIHQQGQHQVYVSDIIHKRGHKLTDDILLMEEQQLESYGDPLSTNSKLGQMKALQVLPALNTANGEGDLVAYYDYGVVSYNTFQFPRETRADAEGKEIQAGWESKRMVSHLLNTISAVGRYAVAVLPRDHAFRSRFGLHFLRSATGSEVLNDESVNTFSQDVQPILDGDLPDELSGAAVGHWIDGSRLFATTGLHSSDLHSSAPMGKGFVSFNQSTTFTEDRTPRPVWEGLWVVDNKVQGIHQFLNVTDPTSRDAFGFVCSNKDAEVYFAEPCKTLLVDMRDGEEVPIEWQVTTRKEMMRNLGGLKNVGSGRLEVVASHYSEKLRVMVRTDEQPEWKLWREFDFEDVDVDVLVLNNLDLGKPPMDCREASWFQVKIEGVGQLEIHQLEIEYSEVTAKTGRKSSKHISRRTNEDHFAINNQPTSDRWTSK